MFNLRGLVRYILILLALGVILTLLFTPLEVYKCKKELEFMELKGDYDYIYGCYLITYSDKKILLKNYSIREEPTDEK